jgi:hypothetical protein
MGSVHIRVRPPFGPLAVAITSMLLVGGCGPGDRSKDRPVVRAAPRVVVVAPVLNLSGTPDLDSLKFTDIVASEFLSFPSVSVVPVNLTLAALERRGAAWVETPADAVGLAREFGADATLVTAVTEFDPYDPPTVGLIMQWYAAGRDSSGAGLEPVAGPPSASASGGELSAAAEPVPQFQVQRVFNAADNQVQDEVREFSRRRAGDQSPLGFRRVLRSQELYVRYCCHAMIRSIAQQNVEFSAAQQSEVSP